MHAQVYKSHLLFFLYMITSCGGDFSTLLKTGVVTLEILLYVYKHLSNFYRSFETAVFSSLFYEIEKDLRRIFF